MKLILEKMIFQSTMKFETKTTTWTVTKTLQILEKLSYLSPEYIVSQFLYLVISELCLLTTKIQKIIISTKKIKAHGPPSDSSKKLKKIPDFQPCKKLCLISISIYSLILILDLPFCQNIPLTIIQTPNSMVLSTSIVDIDFCHFNHPGFWTLDSINFLLMSAIYFHTDNWLAMMKTPDPTTNECDFNSRWPHGILLLCLPRWLDYSTSELICQFRSILIKTTTGRTQFKAFQSDTITH